MSLLYSYTDKKLDNIEYLLKDILYELKELNKKEYLLKEILNEKKLK